MDVFEWLGKVIDVFPEIIMSVLWFFYHWYLWVFVHIIAYRIVRHRWTLESNSIIMWASKYIGLSVLSSSIYVLLQYLTISYSGLEKSWYILNRSSVYYVQLTFSAFSTYWAVIGFGLVIDYYKKFKNSSKTALELKAELAETNLNLLKMQLQPHFVFNTLNTIVSLIYEKPSSAENMVVYLSDFLRKTLQFTEKHLVTIKEELSLLKDYINIILIRYEGQITIEYDIDDSITNVPNLIFQPLVENVVVHNLFNSDDQVNIKITAKKVDDIVTLCVENSYNVNISSGPTTGIGYKNIVHRLNTLYGEKATFEAGKANMNTYSVQISFPNKSREII